MNLAIIGGGSWGTALSIVLAPRAERISLWVYESGLAARMAESRENDVFLPGFKLPQKLAVTNRLEEALAGAHVVVGVMPSQHARRIYSAMAPHLTPDAILVSATKGLEQSTLHRISEVVREVIPFEPRLAILSGPTFAREVARGDPTAVVVAGNDPAVTSCVQQALSSSHLRLYTNSDPVSVEIGAALKNVFAIGAGICFGLGLGNNTMAALITRGLAEITRLAVAMGGQPQTLAGLAGLGDLVLTCTGELSRNRKVGLELASGKRLPEILASTPMVAEGVETCGAAAALGAKYGVDLPIIQQMQAVLQETKDPRVATRELMDRSLRAE